MEINQEQKCRVCGCTDTHACPGGCFWVEYDLCSACADPESETFFQDDLDCSFSPVQLEMLNRFISDMRTKPVNDTRRNYLRSLKIFVEFINWLECFGFISSERCAAWTKELADILSQA